MRTTSLRALLWVCAGVAGCTTSGTEDAGAELVATEMPRSGTLALMRLESFPPSDATPARVVTNAKVARYSGLDGSSVLKLLGVDVRDGESCSVSGRLDDFPLAPDARVELLSVGDMSLKLGTQAITLSPRLFPDLAATASGWFYAGNAEMSAAPERLSDGGVDRGDEYVLAAQGLAGVGRFELSVAAPSEVLGLELAGASLAVQGTLSRASDASLTWEPEDMRDRLEIEVDAGGSVLSCSVRDDGQFTLPRQKLALLEPDDKASLVVRRVRVIATDMQGIETAYVRFATTKNLSVRVE
ncbi:MAG: hypothetical protein JWN48_3249 [Myxococcaceae bacterium]|nr:hypothetical protein [Myxococcaceae bacterium]